VELRASELSGKDAAPLDDCKGLERGSLATHEVHPVQLEKEILLYAKLCFPAQALVL
jgi:hypothetical protein